MKRVVFSRFKKVILSLISVFLILISCSFILSAPINKNVSNFNDKDIPLSLKAADYPFGISPIIIDDNWTETEVLYEWCSGSGAWGDPFVIDNITLDCKEKSSGLVINNSDQYYFIIQNCTFYNCSSFPAIIIQNSKNGIVHECNFSRNNQIGIQLVKTDNCSFTFNTISYNEIGIYLEKTSECGFYKNNITHNSVEGVSISTTNSDLNLFYLNNFSSNGLNAYDAADNTWDNGSIGNYWDDYVGHDLDDDGIGDDPYIIDSDSQDNFPIWNDGDDINPTLTVLSPSNNTLWSTPPLINVSAFDLNLDTIWYLVNDSEQATILQNESAECLLDSLWNSLGQGKFNLTFYANDTVGNINNPLTIDLYKDTNNPFISINSPANHTFWNHRPPIEVSVSDSHFQAVWYEVNGQKEMLANGVSEILNDSIWDSILDESSFTVYFYANDSAGNMNATKTLDLYKDVINPTLSVDLPSDGLYCNTRPNIQATASDINLDSLWYDIGGTKILLDNGISELLDQGIWDSLSAEETFTIYFFANDSAGNINSPYSRIIHKDISNPIITVNSPLNDTYWNIRPNIQVSVSDTNFDSVWYEVDGLKIMLENGVSELLDQSIWGSLSPEDTFTIYFFANDSAGNINSLYSRTIHKDVTDPSLTIGFPMDGTYWNTRPYIQATASDTNFDSVWYEVNGLKILLSNGVSELLDQNIWDSLSPEDTFTIYFFANDSAGNLNSLYSKTIHKDVTDPTLTVNLPFDGTYCNTPPSIQATAVDTNFDSVWYEIGGVKILLDNGISELLDQGIWDSLSAEETFTIYFFANDSAGNINSLYSRIIHKDISNPTVTVNSPLDGSYWNVRPNIQVSISDMNFDSVWYEVDATKIMLENGISELLDQSIWNSLLDEEIFTIYFYANDSAGNINSLYSITIHKDVTDPSLTVDLPLDNTYWNTLPSIQATASDTNFDAVWYEIGGVKVLLENGIVELLDQAIWDALSAEEMFTIYFYANDSAGNVNSLNSRTIQKDIIDPSLTVDLPLNNTYWNTLPSIQATASDTNFNSVWYELGGVKVLLENGVPELLDQNIWDSLFAEETFTIYFYANDSAGNINSLYSRIIHKDVIDPVLTVNLPLDGTYWNTRPSIQATATDTNLDSLWYVVNGIKIKLENGISEALDLSIWEDLLDEESFVVHFYANDSAGNINSLYFRTIHKDITNPILTVDLPLDGTYWNTRPSIQATASDTNFESVWYEVDGTKIMLENGISELLDQSIWDNLLAEETFTIYFFANDSAGNINSLHFYTIHKDVIDPTLTVNLPLNNTYWNIRPNVQATASDTNFDSVWYVVDGIKIILENGVSELFDQNIWDSFSLEATFSISFFANDSAGNVNSLYTRTIHKDIHDPDLVINLPLDDTYWNTRPSIQVTATDTNFDSVWYEVNSLKILLNNGVSELLNQDIWDALAVEESFTIHYYANDSAGNINSLYSQTIHKDVLDPSLTIDFPLNDTYWNTRPSIQATASDTNFDSVWYEVNGIKVVLDNGLSELLDQSIWDALSDEETFIIYFFANDSAGNVNSIHMHTVHKDITAPNLSANLPLDGTYWNSLPTIQATATDINFDSIWYKVDGIKIMLENGVSELLDQNIWDALLAEETFTIYFYANDSAGNMNSLYSRTIHKDVTDPSLTVNLPLDGTYWHVRPSIQATASDTNFDSVWYEVGGVKILLDNGVSELLDQSIWDSLSAEQTFTIYFFASDSAGNVNSLYSLTIDKDISDPIITVNSPLDGTYWNVRPNIQVTASDINFDSVWYEVGGMKGILENGISELFDQNIWDSLSAEETFTIYFFANDSAGNVNSLYSRTIHKDIADPTLTVNLPLDGTYWNARPSIQVSASDTNLDSLWYVVNGIKIALENGISETLDLNIWEDLLDEETFVILFYANDSAGNINSLNSLTIHKDITDPALTISLPINDTYWNVRPNIQVTASDANFDSVWYEVGGIKVILENGVSELLDQNIWDSLSAEETFTIYFFANDSAGNVNSLYSRTIHKDITDPTLTVNLPLDGTYWNARPSIQVTATDTNFDSVWYEVNSLNILLNNGVSELLNQDIWDAMLAEETFTIYFYANDSAGNVNSLYTRTIHKDTTIPNLLVNLPLNNTYWNMRPNIQVDANDLNLDSVWYVVKGSKVILDNGVSKQFEQANWDALTAEETFTIYFFANDSAGNINSLYSCILHKDTKGPDITITNPSDYDVFGLTAPSCIINFYDLNGIDERWYQLSNGTFTTPIRYWSGSISIDDWDLMQNGTVSIIFYANDSVGNIETSNTLVYKDVISPLMLINSPQPYDLFGTTPPTIGLYVYDPHLETIWYQLENETLLTGLFSWTGSISSVNWNLMGNGTVKIHFFAYDSVNNIAYINLIIRKNIFDPIVTILNPVNGTIVGQIPPVINLYVASAEADSIWYYLSNGTIATSNTTWTGSIDVNLWNLFDDGYVTIHFYINDTLGNLGSDSMEIVKDLTSPTISVDTPDNFDIFGKSPPSISINFYDLHGVDQIWYQLYHFTLTTPLRNWEGTINNDDWSMMPNGTITIIFFVNDTVGNLASRNITVYKDSIDPSLTINLPLENTYYNSRPTIQALASDQNFDSVWYVVGSTKIIIENGIEEILDQGIWDSLSAEETFTIYFFANDTVGNVNALHSVTLHKDIYAPKITIGMPINDTYWNNPPNIQVTAFDLNFDSIWYVIGGTKVMLENGVSQLFNQNIWDDLVGENSFIIHFYANDSAGNVNSSVSVTIHKDIKSPEITISHPSENDTFGKEKPEVTVNFYDLNGIDERWYQLTNGITTTNIRQWLGYINNVDWDLMPNGIVLIILYANDSVGNVGSVNISVYKDIIGPNINIYYPNGGSLYGSQKPTIFVYLSDPNNISSIHYQLRNDISSSSMFEWTGVIDQSVWEQFGNGTIYIYIYANDTLGNEANDFILVRKDIIGPSIEITSPQNGQEIGRDSPFFEIHVSDANLDSTWYNIMGENSDITFNGTYGRINETLWESIWDSTEENGTIVIRFYACDTLGNEQFKDLVLVKPITQPGPENPDNGKLPVFPINLIELIPLTLVVGFTATISVIVKKSRFYSVTNKKHQKLINRILILVALLSTLVTISFII